MSTDGEMKYLALCDCHNPSYNIYDIIEVEGEDYFITQISIGLGICSGRPTTGKILFLIPVDKNAERMQHYLEN